MCGSEALVQKQRYRSTALPVKQNISEDGWSKQIINQEMWKGKYKQVNTNCIQIKRHIRDWRKICGGNLHTFLPFGTKVKGLKRSYRLRFKDAKQKKALTDHEFNLSLILYL
jgi:hypothetical protein